MILVCWYKFVSLCLQGWVLAHFRHVVPRRPFEDYDREDPYVGRWKPPWGFADVVHFRGLMDSMEHCHVIWRSYEHRRVIWLDWMNDEKMMKLTEWMYEWMKEWRKLGNMKFLPVQVFCTDLVWVNSRRSCILRDLRHTEINTSVT